MNRTNSILIRLQWLVVFILVACSNQKNTPTTRAYHNLTAHFNVLFNGQESFRKALKKIDANFKDDYSRVLPVFTYGDDAIAKTISPEMDVAIRKGAKLIFLHSIKAKPKIKKGRMTPKEKEFYNKNEYNNWVDVAYLMMAKANFYKHVYKTSSDILNFVEREFAKQHSHYEAWIWQARIYSETKEYRDAERILTKMDGDNNFPEDLKLDLYTTMADVAIKQNQYEGAVKPLLKALKLVSSKKLKIRYTYILAQLYQKNGSLKEASKMYTIVIRKSPSYEMSFNARINLAATIENGDKNNQYIKSQLAKMLKDEKNSDYQDQIYYALGNISMKENNESQAIENYRKSVKVSKKNQNQKALSCITLADLYYDKKKYIPSQAYYDTAIHIIKENYPNYSDIKSRAECLTHLVENLNTISREDSLQRIALLPEAERLKIIDGIINDLKKKEEEEQLAEAQRLQEYYNNLKNNSNSQDPNAQAKWYFYNPTSVAQGMKDFQLRWGKRQLEDNWRRKNKGFAELAIDSTETNPENNKEETVKKKIADNKTREFYTQNLPVNDSLMAESHEKVIDSYFNAGLVYRNELKDPLQAVLLYEEMLKRFPENVYKAAVCYQQYNMYNDLNNKEKANQYKIIILTEYPESRFAKIILDPEYYKQLVEISQECDKYYELTYNLYNSGFYAAVITNSDSAFVRFKNNPALPKFALLKSLAIGKSSDILTFRTELNKIITQYPKNEISVSAKEIISYLNTYKPETKQQEDIKIAEVTFNIEEKSTFLFGLVVDKQEDINQIVFDIINFNLDNFPNNHYEVTNETIGTLYKIITVQSLEDQTTALKYYNLLTSKPSVLKNVKDATRTMFIITPSNLQLLKKQESADGYFEFFKRHILSAND